MRKYQVPAAASTARAPSAGVVVRSFVIIVKAFLLRVSYLR
jgi:hypothetical protein